MVFAADSIPAIFAVTSEPFIVFTANVFALMGLRQLYFLIGGLPANTGRKMLFTGTTVLRLKDGMIVEVASFYQIDPNTWSSVPEWLKEYAKIDEATGEITIPGFENGANKIIPTWLADWVYVNNETGEVFAMEW